MCVISATSSNNNVSLHYFLSSYLGRTDRRLHIHFFLDDTLNCSEVKANKTLANKPKTPFMIVFENQVNYTEWRG